MTALQEGMVMMLGCIAGIIIVLLRKEIWEFYTEPRYREDGTAMTLMERAVRTCLVVAQVLAVLLVIYLLINP